MPEVDAEKEEQERLAAEHAAAEAQRTDEVSDDDADAMFDAGFKGEKTPDEDRVPTGLQTDGSPVEPKADEVKPDGKTPDEPTPQVPTLTKEQVDQILSVVTLVPELKSKMEQQFGTAFGKMGGIERALKTFQDASVASGEPIKVSKEDLKEIIDEFPDLSEKLVPVLNRVFERVKIPKAVPTTFDPTAVSKAVDERFAQAELERKTQAIKDLSELHPDWRDVVGAPGGKTAGTETEWQKWLKTQPAWYQKQVNGSWEPVVIAQSIERFRDDAAKTKKAADDAAKAATTQSRKQRLQEAVLPKKPSAAQETTKSDDEMFDEGFKTGRS